MGRELFVTVELAAAVSGRPLPSASYRESLGADLAANLTNAKSGNIDLVGAAVALVRGEPVREAWMAFFGDSERAWMGDEGTSFIYGDMHVAGIGAVAQAAQGVGDAELLAAARAWLRMWWGLQVLAEAPDGRIMLPGMRSGGHEPGPGWREYWLATARGDDDQIRRALAWCHNSGLHPENSWVKTAADALAPALRESYPWLADASPDEVAADLPRYGFLVPVHVYRTPAGVAAWYERNSNPNTPPWLAGVWVNGVEHWAPENGGLFPPGHRYRQQFDRAVVTRDGSVLHYRGSSFPTYLDVDIELPPGDAFEVVIGATSSPVSAKRADPEEPIATPPSTPEREPTTAVSAELDSIAADLSGLRLARADAEKQIAILADLAAVPPRRSFGELADIVASFGINSQSPQAVARDSVVARLRALTSAPPP